MLCQEVATGLGLPAPKATIELEDPDPSPALSQVGGEYPPDGRTVGIVIDPDGDLSGVDALRATIDAAGMVPLLIAPHGGKVKRMPVQRTFATGRSVEYDVLLVAGAPVPAPDALPSRDEKAGADESGRSRPAGPADDRGVLPARQGHRRLGRRRHGLSTPSSTPAPRGRHR